MTPPQNAIEIALQQALCSPCRSKRGAVVFELRDGGTTIAVLGRGQNFKPRGFDCDGSLGCKATCRVEAIHAEQMALLNAGHSSLQHADIIHVKSVDGKLVPSGSPNCVECSKLILARGIAGVWLFHEHGWTRYSAGEFHAVSLAAVRWPTTVRPA